MEPFYKKIISFTLVTAVLAAATAGAVWRDPLIVLGIMMGAVLGLSNYIFLTKIVVKILDENYKRKAFVVLYFLAKIALIFGLLWLGFWVFHLNFLAFVAGYSCLMLGILLAQVATAKIEPTV